MMIRRWLVVISLVLVVGISIQGCGGSESSDDNGDDGDNGAVKHTIAAAACSDVRSAIGKNNSRGMIPGQSLGSITLPSCTKSDGSALDYTVNYSVSNLPSWLSLDTSTLALSFASGTSSVPLSANTIAKVIFTGTDASDSTIAASRECAFNDLDGDEVTDGKEYQYGEVPLVNPGVGWVWLTPGNVNLYRTSSKKIPVGITKATGGLDGTKVEDATTDFDGDGTSNSNEVTAGTNPFVAASNGTFGSRTGYTTLPGPAAITTGDFNHDGKLDLATSNAFSGNAFLNVFIGNGDGTFQKLVSYTTGVQPFGIVAGDFSGDGRLDLVVSNQGVNAAGTTVSILFGNGDGSFQAKTDYTAGTGPQHMTAGDFDGDGDLDLAVANRGVTGQQTPTTMSVLLNNGGGTFAAKTDYTLVSSPEKIVTGDFNNDSKLDLAVSNNGLGSGSSFSVFLGNGDGTFGTRSDYSTGTAPAGISTGDVDGDGDLDLAVVLHGPDSGLGSTVVVHLGSGDGTFAAPLAEYATGAGPRDVIMLDVDGDAKLDLAVTNGGGSSSNVGKTFSILTGNGDGTFDAKTDYATASGPRLLVAGDFNNDGKLDLALSEPDGTFSGTTLGVFINQ